MRKKFSRCGLLALLVFVVLGMAPVTVQGAMPDEAFIELCKKGTAEKVHGELASGANVNAKGDLDMTALMNAAYCNSNPEVVQVLLEGGADVYAVDKDGHDAIWWAQRREKGDKEKIIQILEEYASYGR